MLRFLSPVMLLGVAAGFLSCASFYRETVRAPASAEKIDTRDFAIDTCFPNANEKELAQAKAIAFWQKHALRFAQNLVTWRWKRQRSSQARFKT
jgi:hypothetical protein